MRSIQLFCFPFAGGSSYSYNIFLSHCGENIRIIPIELPGRGRRINENLLTRMDEITHDVVRQVRDKLDAPYAFYGHSMGSLTAYLVTKEIIRLGLPMPQHLFVSGAGGPSFDDKTPPRHLLPRHEFIEELKKMGGAPEEILVSEEMMAFFEPILRADFQAVETYQHIRSAPFDIPITCMIGTQERTNFAEASTWQAETTASFSIRQLPGNHFFIFDFPHTILKLIEESLFKDNHQGRPSNGSIKEM